MNQGTSVLIEIVVIGLILYVFIRFFFDVYRDSVLTIHVTDKKAGRIEKAAFSMIDLSRYILSYILLLFMLFLLPAAFILLHNFFDQVVVKGIKLNVFIANVPNMMPSVGNFYISSWRWVGAFLYSLLPS